MSEDKHTIRIKEELYSQIKDYCNFNKIHIQDFINETLNKGFMLEKYGNVPFMDYFSDVKKKQLQEKKDEELREQILNASIATKSMDIDDAPIKSDINVQKTGNKVSVPGVFVQKIQEIENKRNETDKKEENTNNNVNILIEPKPKKRRLK